MNKLIILLLFTLAFSSCSKKKSPAPAPAPKAVDYNVVQMTGQILYLPASDLVTVIKSPVIYDEANNMVRDGKKFTIMGNDEIKVSSDGLSFSDKTEVVSESGKISIYTKNQTNKKGSYRLKVIAENTGVSSWYYVNIEAGDPYRVDKIIGTQYHDDPPYNGVKDANEYWTVSADGTSVAYFTVGLIYDKYDNIVENANVSLSTDKGTLVSASPVISTEGEAVFSLMSSNDDGIVNLEARVYDRAGTNVLVTKTLPIKFIKPILTLDQPLDFGNVLVNETKTVVYTLKNEGSGDAKNITYNLDQPFAINNASSTCLTKTTLKSGEQCSLSISFTAGVRATLEGKLQIVGSPTSISSASIVQMMSANGVAGPTIEVSSVTYDYDTLGCGTIYDKVIYVKNTGDLTGMNFHAVQAPNLVNGDPSPMQIVLPPKDLNPSTDMNDIIECGNTLPPGRKCKVIVRYHPMQLASVLEYYGSIAVDGVSPVGFIMRGGAKAGEASGTLPITFFNPDISNTLPVQSIPSSSASRARVVVGPVADACGNNVIDGTKVDVTIQKGSMISTSTVTNNGLAEFEWKGSDDFNDIGPQPINAQTLNLVQGNAILKFDGVKLSLTGVSNFGQVLTKKPVTRYYTLTNDGTILASNINASLVYNNSLDTNGDGVPDRGSWGIVDSAYDGGCKSGNLAAGSSCQIKVVVNTLPFGVGHFEGDLSISSIGRGLNTAKLGLSGMSQEPPVLKLDQNNYEFGTLPAATVLHTKTLTLTNLGPAIAQGLNIVASQPYSVVSHTCGTNLSGSTGTNICQIILALNINQVGTYSGTLNITSEFASVTANLNGSIAPALASGDIEIAFDKSSVPSDRASLINVAIGPVKDSFGNPVALGVPVTVSYNAGVLNLDSQNTGSVVISTNASGMVYATIRSKALDEVKTFTITAKVIDGGVAVAQGSKSGDFTGAIANFPDTILDFGGTIVGVLSTKTIQLKNEGTEALSNLNFILSNGDYSVVDYGACAGSPKKILAGQTCNIVVGYFPSATGGSNGVLTVTGTGNGVLSDKINLVGTALLPAKLVTQLSVVDVTVLPGGNTGGTITIRNDGNETVSNMTYSIDNHPEYFTINMSTCLSIGGLGTCTVAYTFNPTSLASGDFIAQITFAGDSPSRVVAVDQSFVAHPSTIAITSSNSSIYTEECTNIALKTTNLSGETVNSMQNINISLASALAGTYYSGTNCSGSVITTVPLAAGQNTVTGFSFKSLASGNQILTASHPTVLTGQMSLISTGLVLTTTPVTNPFMSNLGECEKFVIVLKTPAGAIYNAKSEFQLSMSTTGTGLFYGDNTCSTNQLTAGYVNFPINTNQMTIYYKPTAVGTSTVVSFTAPNKTANPITFDVYNLINLSITSNSTASCTKAGSPVSCPPSIIMSGGEVYLNNIEKIVTVNITTSSNIITLDSTSNISVGDLVVAKTKPSSNTDMASISKSEYFRVLAVLSSTTIQVKNIDTNGNPTLAQTSGSNRLRLYVIPEFFNVYYKTGYRTRSSVMNFSSYAGGVVGLKVYNRFVGERSSPVNSQYTPNGTLYGDGITIYVDENNVTYIYGGN